MTTNLTRIREAFEARSKCAADLRALADSAANREFTGEERETVGRLEATIAQHDDTIRSLTETASASDVDPRGEMRSDVSQPFGEFLRDLFEGRAVGSGGGSAGVLVPEVISSRLVEMTTQRARLVEAGLTVVTMDGPKVTIPKVATEPQPAWRAESGPLAEGAPTFTGVDLDAKSLGLLVRSAREIVADAPRLGEAVASIIAKRFAQAIDLAGLSGGGVNAPASIFAGIAPTTGTVTYDALAEALATLEGRGYDPAQVVALVSPADAKALAFEADTAGGYKGRPGYAPRVLAANAVTTGEAYVADFSRLGALGIRQGLEVDVLRERFADLHEIAWAATARVDFAQTDADAAVVLNPAA